jgi:ATP-binding cassette subfamily C protein
MFKRLMTIFWRAPGARPFLVAGAMWFSSFSDLLGMGALVPLASQLSSDQGANNSLLGHSIMAAMTAVHVTPSFTNLLIFLGVALVMKSIIAFLAMRFVAISVANVATEIRRRLLNSTMNARWSYFVDHQPGEVSGMIAAQSQMAGDAYLAVSNLVVTVIVGIGLLVTAFMVSGTLVLFCLFAVSALAFPLYYILRRAQAASMKQFSTSANLMSGVQDVMANMKALKSMAKQGRFVDAFMKSIADLRGSVIAMLVARHAIYHGQDILGALMVISGVYVGVELLHTPLSQLLVVGVIFYQLVDITKRVQVSLQDATMASAGYFGVYAIIDRAAAQAEDDTGVEEPTLNTKLEFKDVSFSYGEMSILKNVNLLIPAKSITVLIGPSGAGKTTIVDLIVGFYRPLSGRILVDGVNLRDIKASSWRSKIGYVPQELTLLKGNIFDNITLGDPALSEEDALEALRMAGAADFINALPDGIKSDIGTMGARLSGGQRQRLSLARALVHKPQLLLLDEVTSALDAVTEAEICRNIQQLLGQLTIIAITHRPAWVGVATKVYNVAGGNVVEEGSASNASVTTQTVES